MSAATGGRQRRRAASHVARGDRPTTDYAVAVVEDGGLTRGQRALRVIEVDAGLLADDGAVLIHDRPGLDPLAEAVLEQRPVAAVRDEADLLALWLERGDQAERPCLVADLGLGPVANGKAQDPELLLAKLVEHIGLVLALVDGAPQPKAVGTLIDARIVAGR